MSVDRNQSCSVIGIAALWRKFVENAVDAAAQGLVSLDQLRWAVFHVPRTGELPTPSGSTVSAQYRLRAAAIRNCAELFCAAS